MRRGQRAVTSACAVGRTLALSARLVVERAIESREIKCTLRVPGLFGRYFALAAESPTQLESKCRTVEKGGSAPRPMPRKTPAHSAVV